MTSPDELVLADLDDDSCIDITGSSGAGRQVIGTVLDGWKPGTARVSVRDVMTSSPVTVTADARAADIALLLATHAIGAVVVCDEQGRAVGMITDRDLMVEILARDRSPGTCANDIIHHRPVATVDVDAGIEVAVEIMRARSVRRLPVTEGSVVVGILSQADIARAIAPQAVGALVEVISRSADNSAEG